MFDISLESMQALIQSRLGKELDAIWQDVIDYRDSTLADMSFKNKLRALRTYFEKHSVQKFKEVVWKYVGLHIDSVHILDILSTGSFCTWMYMDKEAGRMNGTFQIESIVNADYIFKSYPTFRISQSGNKPFTADDLLKIANSFDKNTGGIKTAVKAELSKWINAEIGFDVTTAFAIEDMLPPKSGVSNFTAREITAVILHELGHNLTLIEHAADCYARISTFRYLETAFKNANKNNPAEAIDLARKVSKEIEKIDKETSDNLNSIADKISTAVESNKNKDYGPNRDGVIVGLIEIAMGILSWKYLIPISMAFGNQQGKRFANQWYEQHHKLSDIPVNERLATWMERKSDEYAFSHGYGAEIVSSLDKLTKFMARRGMSEKAIANLNDIEKQGKIFRLFKALRLIALLPAMAGTYSYSLYPAGVKRYKEVLRLTIQKLKQYSTDPEYVAKYIKDCEKIIEIIDHPSSADEMEAKLYRCYDLFMKYCSLPSFIDWIVHGRVRRDIEDLIRDVEAAGNSLLTYYGHKLQQI